MARNFSDELKTSMTRLIENYTQMRGVHVKDKKMPFWDAVVISSLDYQQKEAFETQIAMKYKSEELPLGIPFHVFSDPPGHKIGCGGSALYVLEQLVTMYRSAFDNMRILFLPAGGYSQRLPSWSVLGKLFCPVPVDSDQKFQMIDVLLSIYLPFLKKMPPGVFLTSCDSIISYNLDEQEEWTFENHGFTALAHPSPILIGTHHGVYVLDNCAEGGRTTFMSECSEVLQKPTEETMRQKGAVLQQNSDFLGMEEIVYSDSVFFFVADVARKLAHLHKEIEPVKCEISSYGDFLPPLGKLFKPSCVVSDNPKLNDCCIKLKLSELLDGISLSILVLRESIFNHFGTMHEYLRNFCSAGEFQNYFPLTNLIPNVSVSYSSNIKGTVINSVLDAASNIDPSSIVEYSSVPVPLFTGENSILSNLDLEGTKYDSIDFPPNLLIHTISVEGGYVTICFGMNDDIKRSCEAEDAGNLVYLNHKFEKVINMFKYHSIFPSNETVSLWTARLFPVCYSAAESANCAIDLLNFVINSRPLTDANVVDVVYFSMSDIMMFKDYTKMINHHCFLEKEVKCKNESRSKEPL